MTLTYPIRFVFALWAAFALSSAGVSAQAPGARDIVEAVLKKDGPDYVRFHAGAKRSSLDTKITRFKTEDGEREIALISAIHIADAAYYRRLTKELEAFDLVLFEGVAMREGDEPDEVLTALGRLQRDLGAALGLTHQKGAIATEGPRFLRADLDSREIKDELDRREIELLPGANLIQSFGPFLQRSLRMLTPKEGEKPGGWKGALRSKAKMAVARVLAEGDALYAKMKGEDGKKRDEVIIGARNARAMKELDTALAREKAPRKIAILYGAAHMADFETRLKKRFPGLKETGSSWVEAWSLGGDPAAAKKEPKKDAAPPKKRDL